MKKTRQNSNNNNTATRVSIINIIINLVLSLVKLIAGIFANSVALISDAVHSASDVFSSLIVIIGVKASNREADRNHQYGHERMESVASIILAVILFATGIGIGINGIEKIFTGDYQELKVPGMIALVVALLSILVKEWMYWFTRAAAKKIDSGALLADAWHHRSDALSSVSAFIGIFGARLGFPVLDSVASLIICIFIGKAAYDIFKDAVNRMVDRSCCEETEERIKLVIKTQRGVLQIDRLKTRLFGTKIYVDVDISADGNLTLEESHEIARKVHDAIEKEFSEVKHCMVHVNPKK